MLWHYLHDSDGCCIPLHMEKEMQYRSKLSSYAEKEVEASFITVLGPGSHIKEKCLCLKALHCGSLPVTKQFMENKPQCSAQSVSYKAGTLAPWEGLVLQVACKAKFCLRMSFTMKWDMGRWTTNDPKILVPVTQFPSFHCCQLQTTRIFCCWCFLLGCWRILHPSSTQELQRHGNRRASWDTADCLSRGRGREE